MPGQTETIGQAINLEGIVTRIYLDAASVHHGFFVFPQPKVWQHFEEQIAPLRYFRDNLDLLDAFFFSPD
jgi:hypothetical protein